jgi:arsenate reductase
MLTIYHNPRCGKSREGLQLIESLNLPFTVIKYLDTPLTKDELKDIISKLGIAPIELVRQKEEIWKVNFKGKTLTSDEVIDAMVQYPTLIERPIIVNGDKAVIARPAEKAQEIL